MAAVSIIMLDKEKIMMFLADGLSYIQMVTKNKYFPLHLL